MARVTVTSATGEDFQVDLPEFAMDSTAGDMLGILKKLYGDSTAGNKEIKDAINSGTQETLDSDKNIDKSTKEGFKELSDAFNDFKKQVDTETDAKAQEEYNRRVAKTNTFLEKSTDRLAGFGFGLVSVTSLIAVGLFNAVTNAGESLNELTKAGVGFGDAQGSTIDALAELSTVGIDATQFLTQFSRAAGVLGVNQIAKMSREFDTINQSGIKLGMSLEESAERYGEELDQRARLGIVNGVQAMQIAKETKQTMETQQKYAQALGISTGELRTFTDGLITGTNILSGSLLRFNASTQSAMYAGVKEFGTIMAGMGGEGGKDIATAMTEAAAGGALGFSSSLVAMTAVLPRLQKTTVELSTAMQNGTLTQE